MARTNPRENPAPGPTRLRAKASANRNTSCGASLPLAHYGALPFTRLTAGHADFLPGYVQPRFLKNTTIIFQMACVLVFSSPFLCWPDNPEAYLHSPLLQFVRTVPVTWDETRILSGSVIGDTVIMARRKGAEWYVAVLNCRSEARTLELDLSGLDLRRQGTDTVSRRSNQPGLPDRERRETTGRWQVFHRPSARQRLHRPRSFAEDIPRLEVVKGTIKGFWKRSSDGHSIGPVSGRNSSSALPPYWRGGPAASSSPLKLFPKHPAPNCSPYGQCSTRSKFAGGGSALAS